MDGISIREHGFRDRAFLRRMLEEAASSTYPELKKLGDRLRGERLAEIFEHYYAQDRKRIWVAEADGGRLVGMIWLQPTLHPVSELSDYLIVNLAVDPGFQRRGIGRLLVLTARDYCAGQGVRRLRLFVGADNESAYRLYATLGFVEQTREMLWTF